MSRPTGFYLHPSSPLHDTGWSHPEHQGRLRALASTVGKDLLTLHGHVEQRPSGESDDDDLLRVHTLEHLRRVRDACDAAETSGRIESLDSDTRVSSASWDAAVGSAGTAMAAVRDVHEGAIANAFVATRPPGHHATPTTPMGFCLFNNLAVAARWLQAEGRAERVLVVDWDVHHGNGTQDVFYDDATVYFLSLHQSPHYPGTGAASERGSGGGEGTTLNVPLPAGIPRTDYRERFTQSLATVLGDFDPDFVLVSAGFDCLAGDPLGGFVLEPSDLYGMTREIVELSERECGGRCVHFLEGGYDPKRLGQGTVAVIRALAGLDPPED
ncbi:MAG: histone deacetylase [Gemmatimonadetes bacterium]|nr:histone deacetylase [Gemmatimonadota bacterium]